MLFVVVIATILTIVSTAVRACEAPKLDAKDIVEKVSNLVKDKRTLVGLEGLSGISVELDILDGLYDISQETGTEFDVAGVVYGILKSNGEYDKANLKDFEKAMGLAQKQESNSEMNLVFPLQAETMFPYINNLSKDGGISLRDLAHASKVNRMGIAEAISGILHSVSSKDTETTEYAKAELIKLVEEAKLTPLGKKTKLRERRKKANYLSWKSVAVGGGIIVLICGVAYYLLNRRASF